MCILRAKFWERGRGEKGMDDVNEKQRRGGGSGPLVILSLIVLLLAGMGLAYILTTVNLYSRLQQLEGQQLSSRTGTLEEDTTQLQQNLTYTLDRLEMLETKEMSLQARLDRVELDSLANVTTVESGKCSFYGPDREVAYTLYSYTLQNLTHYFVEFGGNTTVIGTTGTSTPLDCSPIEYARRGVFFIYGCSVVYPTFGTPSMINALYDNSFSVDAFRPADVLKFTSPDAGPILLSYAPTSWGACAPATYSLVPAMLPGTQIEGFQIRIYIFFAEPVVFPTVTLAPGLRIPLRGAFSVTKK